MNENNETETEALTKEELATRVEQLEATVEKMIPTRREALGMGASAVAAGGLSQLLFGEAKAGSQQSGTIGSQSNVQDWYVEDLYDHNGNQPLSLPGNGSVKIDEADLVNETAITATRSSDTSSQTSGSFVNVFDGESEDVRGEFNASAQFVPDKSGRYLIYVQYDMRGSTVTGDGLDLRVVDVTNSIHESFQRLEAVNNPDIQERTVIVKLDAGDAHEIQIKNRNSSFTVESTNTIGHIIRSVV